MRGPILLTLSVLCALVIVGASSAAENGEIRAMLKAARRYADEDARLKKEPDLRLLYDISVEQYRSGDVVEARETFSATTAAVRGGNDCPVSGYLTGIAKVQWETGGIAEASATMKAVLAAGIAADRKAKEECLKPLAELQLEIGDVDGALATAELIPSARKTDLYPAIAARLARDGRLDDAVAAYARSSPLPTEDEKRLYRLGADPAGRWPEWISAMKKVDPRLVAQHFHYVAREAALAGDFKTADAAVKAANRGDVYMWEEVALGHARHGDIPGALRIIDSRLAGDPDAQGMALLRLAEMPSRAGDPPRAAIRARGLAASAKGQKEGDANRRLVSLALENRFDEAAELIGREHSASAGFAVEELCRRGRTTDALELVDAVGFHSIMDSHIAVDDVLTAYAERGDFDKLNKALSDHPSGEYLDKWLPAVAEGQARRGDIRGALRTVLLVREDAFAGRRGIYEAVAQAQMESAVLPLPPDWIGGLVYSDEKARAWLGAARGARLERERAERPRW